MTVKGILIEARRLVFRHWVQDSFAVDVNGNEVLFDSPEAHGFCMLGSVRKAAQYLELAETPTHIEAIKVLQAIAGYRLISSNDDKLTTRGTVLSWIDRAVISCDKKNSHPALDEPITTKVNVILTRK